MSERQYLEKVKGFKFYNDITMITLEDVSKSNLIKFVSELDDFRYTALKGYDKGIIVIECCNYGEVQYKILELHKKLEESNIAHNYSQQNAKITIL